MTGFPKISCVRLEHAAYQQLRRQVLVNSVCDGCLPPSHAATVAGRDSVCKRLLFNQQRNFRTLPKFPHATSPKNKKKSP